MMLTGEAKLFPFIAVIETADYFPNKNFLNASNFDLIYRLNSAVIMAQNQSL